MNCASTLPRGRVTVVLPTYNRAELLPAAIDSALAQTVADRCDIVVVDDGGTDHTAEVVRQFDGKIQYIKQVSAGVSAARNTAIKARPNAFYAFLDSDDEWLSQTVELQLAAMRRYPRAVLVTGRTTCRGPDGVETPPEVPCLPYDRPFDLAPYLFERCVIQTPAIMVRGAALSRAGLFRRELRNCGDHELWVRIACQGPSVYLSSQLAVISREPLERLTGSADRAFKADLRARYRMQGALRRRPDCRTHWRHGTARTLQILRDHAYRDRRYPAAARYGFRSLATCPWNRPRWEWGRLAQCAWRGFSA